MIHLYFGDGKGKTTAAVGLAVRASGAGKKVLFAQFFKDGSSNEVKVLRELPNINLLYPDAYSGRWKTMTEEHQKQISESYFRTMEKVIAASHSYDLIILDEFISAYRYCFSEDEKQSLLSFICKFKSVQPSPDLILTGRDPAPELLSLADYATEMKKHAHPFDAGISAREGIEY